jgi:hypothetical protein
MEYESEKVFKTHMNLKIGAEAHARKMKAISSDISSWEILLDLKKG